MNLNRVLIIGAGTMGQGIAQWFFEQGLEVYLCDQNAEAAFLAYSQMLKKWQKKSAEQYLRAKDAFTIVTLQDLPMEVDLVIEAIFEDLEKKIELFLWLDQKLPPATLLASNTSSFSINELSQKLSPSRRTQFMGLHFFNPAQVMKLVEVIASLETDKRVIEFLLQWFLSHGKAPCLCEDSPGFIVNRIARHFYGEPLRAVKSFDKEKFLEIDEIMKKVGGFKMGPFELMDLIGVDINFKVTESIYRSFFYEPRFKPHRLQQRLFSAGHWGKKTGKGFYQYEKFENNDRSRQIPSALWASQ